MSQLCKHCKKQPVTVVKTSKYTSETLHVCQQCSTKIDQAKVAWEQVAKKGY